MEMLDAGSQRIAFHSETVRSKNALRSQSELKSMSDLRRRRSLGEMATCAFRSAPAFALNSLMSTEEEMFGWPL